MRKSIALLLAITLPVIASAQLVSFTGTFSGSQEVPPNASPATGWATATLDLSTNFFELDYAFSGLLAPQTAAHIHVAPVGVSGPVVIPLPLGSPVNYVASLSADDVADLMAGLWYVNVHSTDFPAGEIRAQLLMETSPVPEPSTYALFGAILLGILAAVRRRKMRR